MKQLIKAEVIVLRAYESGDRDLVLHLLSPNLGKFSAVAKNARQKKRTFGKTFDLFDKGVVEFSKSSTALPILKTFDPSPFCQNLRTDLDRLCLASLLIEAVDFLLKEGSEYDGSIYDALCLGLQAINEEKGLREQLRSTFYSLSSILMFVGIHDTSAEGGPSIRSFLNLLTAIEHFAERNLQTRKSVEELVHRYKQSL